MRYIKIVVLLLQFVESVYLYCMLLVVRRFRVLGVFFSKQKTAYELRIIYWSSDVCSSDLPGRAHRRRLPPPRPRAWRSGGARHEERGGVFRGDVRRLARRAGGGAGERQAAPEGARLHPGAFRGAGLYRQDRKSVV